MIQPGLYRHYKGNTYEVIAQGKLEADLSDVVIYRSTVEPILYRVRPLQNFQESVEINGQTIKRFTLIP